MTPLRLRPRSLFWTFAGAFLAVVAVAAVVQLWVLSTLGARLAEEQATSAAQRPAHEVGLDVARGLPPPEIARMLRDASAADGSYFLVFRSTEGKILLPWRAEKAVRHRLARWLSTGVDRWGLDQIYDEAFESPRPPEARGDDRRRRPLHDGRPPRIDRPGPDRPRPGRPLADRPARPAPRPDRRPSRTVDRDDLPPPGDLRLVARVPVLRDDRSFGEVLAVHPVRRGALRSLGETPALFLLPIALALATFGGLVLFRLLTRRLERLESLASRVADGDLAARVERPGHDEVGRLGERLNRMAASLERARDEVDRAVDERKRLLADISHELATPLTTIRGYAETLLDDELPTSPEERALYLENVLDEARRMELLISDLFELTRLEAGIGALEREPLDWSALCRHTLDRYRPRLEQAGLRLTTRLNHSEDPLWVDADGRRMEQVLENLLTNAIRYVPEGGTLDVSMAARDSQVALEIVDDGPGFPAEDLPHVFDRFYRSDATAAIPGSGLGLAIVQEIVLRHGGRVEAENRARGSGAVLRVVLPISRAPR